MAQEKLPFNLGSIFIHKKKLPQNIDSNKMYSRYPEKAQVRNLYYI